LKYKTLHHTARHIDRLIDHNLPSKNSPFPDQATLESLVTCNFPDFYMISHAWHKIVFGNRNIDHKVVLRVGAKKSIANDHHTYKQVPETKRHQYFAKIYWHTKYCLLQQYGEPANVTPEQLRELRQAVYRYGIFDVKADNLRTIDGEIRIIDANTTRIPLPTVLRKIDETKPKIPEKLLNFLKKITKKLYEK